MSCLRHHNIVERKLDCLDIPEDVMLILYINVIIPIRSYAEGNKYQKYLIYMYRCQGCELKPYKI